jgi:hypothetical protein
MPSVTTYLNRSAVGTVKGACASASDARRQLAPVEVHPDPRVQEVHEQLREADPIFPMITSCLMDGDELLRPRL